MDKGTQGKRFGTIGRWTEDWKTSNVGSACLFEKPRSRVGKMLRFSGSLDYTSSDDHHCDNNAYCDSSVYHISDSYQRPKVDKEGYYELNTS